MPGHRGEWNGTASWLLRFLSIAAVLVGIGAAYASLKTRQDTNCERIDKLERAIEDVPEMRTDIRWIRKHLESLSGNS
jgi:hypothetical protein